jgi:hypothetical protein
MTERETFTAEESTERFMFAGSSVPAIDSLRKIEHRIPNTL